MTPLNTQPLSHLASKLEAAGLPAGETLTITSAPKVVGGSVVCVVVEIDLATGKVLSLAVPEQELLALPPARKPLALWELRECLAGVERVYGPNVMMADLPRDVKDMLYGAAAAPSN